MNEEKSNNLNNAIDFVSESMVVIDKIYNFIMMGGFHVIGEKDLDLLQSAILHISDNLDLTMETLVSMENSEKHLKCILEEFERELNGRNKDN